jgi:CTP synthase (UTP-ammonia lyase)
LKGVDELGGTMRLGAYPCRLAEGSFARAAYGADEISERIGTATNSIANSKKFSRVMA